MIVKIHKTHDGRKIVAVCDKDLIGKKFEEGKLQLDFTSEFYKGEEKDEEVIINFFSSAYIVNLAGKGAVNLGLKQGLISKDSLRYVKKIPYAMAILS
jgi:uncharacterized protein